MTNVKSLIARFRAWQREPFQHKNKNCGVVRYHNCGAEFDANFCPICGQEASIGRITWQSVKGNLLYVWGHQQGKEQKHNEYPTIAQNLLYLCQQIR